MIFTPREILRKSELTAIKSEPKVSLIVEFVCRGEGTQPHLFVPYVLDRASC